MDAQLTAFYNECWDEYEKGMSNELETADVYFEDEELQQKHNDAVEKAMTLVCIHYPFIYPENKNSIWC